MPLASGPLCLLRTVRGMLRCQRAGREKGMATNPHLELLSRVPGFSDPTPPPAFFPSSYVSHPNSLDLIERTRGSSLQQVGQRIAGVDTFPTAIR